MNKNFPKNLRLIYKSLSKRIICSALALMVLFLFIDIRYSYSIAVGVLFSALSFYQFMSTQKMILLSKNKALFFLKFLSRMGLYLFPLILGLWKNTYFNFAVILLSLFAYQTAYVLFEVQRNYKTYKRRQ